MFIVNGLSSFGIGYFCFFAYILAEMTLQRYEYSPKRARIFSNIFQSFPKIFVSILIINEMKIFDMAKVFQKVLLCSLLALRKRR